MRFPSILLLSLTTSACGAGIFINPVYPPSTGTTGGSGGTTGSAGGGGTTGTSTGAPSNQGCEPDAGLFEIEAQEYNDCEGNGDCNCPLACVADPDFGVLPVCEYLCPLDGGSYCDDISEICAQGICRANFCNEDDFGDAKPGTPGSLCEAEGGPNTGTCLPQQPVMPLTGMPIVGLCAQGGTIAVGQSCNNGATDILSRHSALCEPGTICVGPSCVPVGAGGCLVWVADGGKHDPGFHDHQPCVASTQCDCPLECVQQDLTDAGLCEVACQDGGGCASPRICTNGFCN